MHPQWNKSQAPFPSMTPPIDPIAQFKANLPEKLSYIFSKTVYFLVDDFLTPTVAGSNTTFCPFFRVYYSFL
jgi:hypothetical protein